MRPINSVASSPPTSSSLASGIKVWKSPIPYLFGGLALMLALISVALFILACFYRKHANSSDSNEDQSMKQAMPKNIQEIKSEPEVLVIMAGDNMPTYLAKPISSSSSSSSSSSPSSIGYCTCGAEPITTPSSN